MGIEAGVSVGSGSVGPSRPNGSSWAILPAAPVPVTMPSRPNAAPAPALPTPITVTRVEPVVSKRVGGSTKTETRYRTTKVQETVVHTLSDNGSGGLGAWGTVNYAGKAVTVRLLSLDSTTDGYKSEHEDSSVFDDPAGTSGTVASNNSLKGGEYLDNAMGEQLLAASTVTVTYSTGSGAEAASVHSFAPPDVTIDLCPYTSDYVVPGSVRFTWMGQVYEDYDGVLIRGRTPTFTGYVAGQMNYATGIATVTDYVVSGSPTAFTLDSLWTIRQNWNTASVFLRTQAAPLKPSGFVMSLVDAQGNSITATAGLDGVITGTHLRGRIEYLTGVAELQFGDYVLDSSLTDDQKAEWWYDPDAVGAVEAGKIWRPWPVDPTTLRYNSVSYFYLPIDAGILGLDPVRLPQDGRVPVFRVGSYVVVGHTGSVGPATVSNGQALNCGRERLSRVRLVGSDGGVIHTGYTADLDAGIVTITDTTGFSQPVTLEHRIEDLVRCADVQIDGTLSFTRQLTHDFPVGSIVSSALMAGTLRARVSHLFDQANWDGITWQDTVIGSAAPGTYNDTAAPIEVTNSGALTERWALHLLTTSTFACIGEHVGNIGTGSTNADFAPINPISGTPYLIVRSQGWGSGWQPGNVLRINTVGAMHPFACIRTVQQGPAAGIDYSFELLGRGDVDRPAP